MKETRIGLTNNNTIRRCFSAYVTAANDLVLREQFCTFLIVGLPNGV